MLVLLLPCVYCEPVVAQDTAHPVSDAVFVPKPEDRVYDPAGVLSSVHAALVGKLSNLQSTKGAEVGIVVLPSLAEVSGGLPIESYTLKVAEHWQLGRKGVDDGAILILALKERRLRIEVGRGLEGAIPDITAKRIINSIIIPRLKVGDVPGGVIAGLDAIINLVSGEALPAPKQNQQDDSSGVLLFVGALLIVVGSLIAIGWGLLAGVACAGGLAFIVASVLLTLSGALLYAIAVGVLTAISNFLGPISPFGGGGGYRSYGGGGGFGGLGSGGIFSGGGASGEW